MKKTLLLLAVLTITIGAFAQEKHMTIVTHGGGPETMGPMPPMPPLRGPGGTWWKDSELATKLKLTDQQKQQLEQTFLDYRLKLVDLHADVERQELKLQPLMDADQVNEAQVSTALDSLIAARGRLEKTNAMMNISMRKVLSIDQWKQLQSLRKERFNVMYHREPGRPGERGTRIRIDGPGEGSGTFETPVPPPAPAPPPGDDN
jgi:Spy/CpxP family protein refolding chaperone